MYTKYCLDRPPHASNVLQADASILVPKPVCGVCVARTDEARKALLEERDRLEVWRLAKLPLVCGECKGPLKATGPMWWINQARQRECRNGTHPPWAG